RSPNGAPEVERALEEFQSTGLFGAGNYQFKNKFRPTNLPIYLCQPAGVEPTPLADIVLMVASPAGPGRPTGPAPAEPAQAGATDRAGLLAAHGYNPVRLRHHLVETDLITDSWAEHGEPFVRQRMRE